MTIDNSGKNGGKPRKISRKKFEARRYNSVIRRAKLRARSELSRVNNGWNYHNYCKDFDLERLQKEENDFPIERIDSRNLTVDEFRSRFETGRGFPVILTHTQDEWLAKGRWTISVSLFYLFKV